MNDPNKIKVALAGVGNLSSALVQAVEYYKKHSTRELMYPKMGGLSIPDIVIVAAFDVDERKVGLDLSKAIFSPPNNQREIMDLPDFGVKVQKSPLLDGLSEYTTDVVKVSTEADVNVSDNEVKNNNASWALSQLHMQNEGLMYYDEFNQIISLNNLAVKQRAILNILLAILIHFGKMNNKMKIVQKECY